jgi:hypothetical protein
MEKSFSELSKYLRNNENEKAKISLKSAKKLFCHEKDYFISRIKNSSILEDIEFYVFKISPHDQEILEDLFFFLANFVAIDQTGRIVNFILKNSLHLQLYQIFKNNGLTEKTLENVKINLLIIFLLNSIFLSSYGCWVI